MEVHRVHGARLCCLFCPQGGPLIPTETGKEDVGFEGFGIASGCHNRFLYHLNGSGLIEEGHPGVLWGGIFELALRRDFSLRLVAELNGESIRGEKPENFALGGVIWELPNGITLDLAGRTGLSQVAFDWEVRGGMTVSFSLFPQMQVSVPTKRLPAVLLNLWHSVNQERFLEGNNSVSPWPGRSLYGPHACFLTNRSPVLILSRKPPY